MTKRLHHVAPLQLGIVLALLYGMIAVVFIIPIALVALFLIPNTGGATHHAAPANMVLPVLVLPVVYAVLGFLGGIIAAAIYNLIARWTGGIEFTLVDRPLTIPPGLPV